jgi:long-chain acyl-CoA synthetase
VERFGDDEFLRFKNSGEWQRLTYVDVARRVRDLALGLVDLGIEPGERLAIWCENRPEWNIADLATLAIGAVDVPVYTTQALSQVEYILSDSRARAIFVSAAFLEKALSIKAKVETLEHVILFDEDPATVDAGLALAAEDLSNRGRSLHGQRPELYEKLCREVGEDDLATLLYTSGTTGEPKGVMLTHKNLTANALNSTCWLELHKRRETALTYLPLTHIFERAVWYVYAYNGTKIAYAESIEAVAQNLQEVRPTVMTSVPRMFEKIYARILERGLAAGFPKRQIFLWSLDVGRSFAEIKDRGEEPGALLSFKQKFADKLVFSKWREGVGGNVRLFISGGAPLAPEIDYLFAAAGLKILQGYGLTETSPSVSCNTESRNRVGTVGPVMDNVEVKIDDDGEILIKGDTVMKGYYNRPEANEEAFTSDGWFRTGDIGHIDPDGFLVITDRKKDLIKTSGGKYIAPQRVESLLKSSRFVSQVVVVGNARKFASALIYPNMDLVKSYAEMKGIAYRDETELLKNPRIIDLMERQVEKYTAELARFEKVKKIALIGREMTIDAGELTPTLKPRRSFIEKKYAAEIDALYREEPSKAAVV